MWRSGARRSCETEYENASSSLLTAASCSLRSPSSPMSVCWRSRMTALSSCTAVSLQHTCSSARSSRHEKRRFRQDDEQQAARADFARNRNGVDAARRATGKHPFVVLHEHRAVRAPRVEQSPVWNGPSRFEVAPSADRHDQLLPLGVPQCRGRARGANGGRHEQAEAVQQFGLRRRFDGQGALGEELVERRRLPQTPQHRGRCEREVVVERRTERGNRDERGNGIAEFRQEGDDDRDHEHHGEQHRAERRMFHAPMGDTAGRRRALSKGERHVKQKPDEVENREDDQNRRLERPFGHPGDEQRNQRGPSSPRERTRATPA